MTFWGVEVKPGEPFTLKSEELGGLLMLTQATLGMGSSTKKSTLQVQVGDKEPIFLCTLLPQKLECFTLNLEFDEEDDVSFSVIGPTSIHLSGIVEVAEEEEDEDEDDGDFDSSGEDIPGSESEDSEFESEDEDDFVVDDDMPMYQHSSARKGGVVIEEIEDDVTPVHEKGGNKQVKKKELLALMDRDTKAQQDEDGLPVSSAGNAESRSEKLQANKKAKKQKNTAKDDGESASNLKRKVDAMDQDHEPKSDAIDGDASEDNKKKKKKKNKKKAKIEKDETVADTKQDVAKAASVKQDDAGEEKKISKAVKETKQANDKPAKLKTYANGFIVEELVMGKPNAKTASRGKKVSVRYIGKLKKGGKIFDSNTSGKPFKFRLGAGQVIKGWDVGVEGMRVGGKRRLTIPPSMGYGSAGALPQIPPNAWLLFDVELVEVA